MIRNTITKEKMRVRLVATAVMVALFATTLPGCIWAPELARLKGDIERQIPGAVFEKEFAITLGPVSMGFARLVTRLVPDAAEARGYLGDVTRVQVAVYNAHRMPPVDHVETPRSLERLRKEGWEMAVKVREEDNVTWVLYKMDKDEIKDLYVIVLSDEELVMVKARGNLERLVGKALSESGGVKGIPHMGDDWEDGWSDPTG
jgi:hypothetical protein